MVNKSKLDPGDYKGTYKVIGGHLCFDFANTVSYRNRDTPHEWLDSFQNISTWTHVTNALSKKDSDYLKEKLILNPAESELWLEKMKAFRAVVFSLFKSIVNQGSPNENDITFLNNKKQELFSEALLEYDKNGFSIKAPKRYSVFQKVEYNILESTFQVLLFSDLSRVKMCKSCYWLFYDTSKNRSRQWCVMSDCGNRNKVNNYNKRQRKAK